MTDSVEIGSYEREVLAALREIGDSQRDQGTRIQSIEAQLIELKKQTSGSLIGLSQRVVSLEVRVTGHDAQIGTLEGQGAGLATRVTATERQAATATGRPLWILAGVGAAVALELLALLALLALQVLP